MQTHTVTLNNWSVTLVVDEDGHLTLAAGNADGGDIIPCQMNLGDGKHWVERLTTSILEEEYKKEFMETF